MRRVGRGIERVFGRGAAAGTAAILIAGAGAAGLGGCQATYSADVRNQTPQPLFAKILWRTDDGRNPIQAQRRLGPGDRGTIGPIQAPVGRAILTLDTLPNPQGVWSIDLRPGTTVFNVTQKGDLTAGPLEVREVSFLPP